MLTLRRFLAQGGVSYRGPRVKPPQRAPSGSERGDARSNSESLHDFEGFLTLNMNGINSGRSTKSPVKWG